MLAEGSDGLFEGIALQVFLLQLPVPWFETIHGYAAGCAPGSGASATCCTPAAAALRTALLPAFLGLLAAIGLTVDGYQRNIKLLFDACCCFPL